MKEYDYIKREIKSLLDADRYIHSLGVEKEAVKLGERYDIDIEKCKIAALVHDCQKNLKDEQLIEKALFYGINIDKIQKKSPQLLHGPVGALYSREKFEIHDEDIINAVYYHTTGRDNMSMLEKIIYIADIIEENRDYFKGLDEIRKLAYIDINKALIMSADSTITYVLQRKNLIHPLTIEFRNSLLLEVESYEKKKRKVYKIFISILIIFIVTIAAAFGYLMSLKNNITSSELPAKEVEGNKPVNILMLGVDAGDYDNKKGNSPKRTDTMILANFHPKEGKIYMLSIPRDTRVNINGHYEKINAAHAMGGVPLTIKTIEKMLGIEINYYVKIDYEAFKKCIDAIGGVDVVVPFDMNYDAYDIKIHFNKGDKVHLNGEKAEKFVRWRKNNDGSGYAMGDLGRISTQQEFIINVFKKLKTPSGMVKIPKLIDTLSKNVKTNMDSKTMVSYLFKLKNIKESSIEKKILQGEPKYIGGISYFIYDKEKNIDYLSHFKLNNAESTEKKNIKVIILNSTGKNGLASEYKNKLISLGYDVVEIGNYSKKLNTTVINYYGQEVYGNDVYEDIGLGKISAAKKNNDKADVVVILGSDAIK